MNPNRIILLAAAVSLLWSCSKPKPDFTITTCKNPDAVNYNKSGDCTYLKDQLLKSPMYNLKVTRYDLDPTQIGTTFTMEVRNSPCTGITDSFYKIVELHWTNGYFYPYDLCVVLNGGACNMNLLWSAAPVSGTGVFTGATFKFTGNETNSLGSYPIVIESY